MSAALIKTPCPRPPTIPPGVRFFPRVEHRPPRPSWSVVSRLPQARRTVLAVGAHPDDVEIGVGGILLRHQKAGDEVVVLTLTGGAGGGSAPRRLREARHAAELMSADLYLADLPDTAVSEGRDTQAIIRAIVERVQPTTVYTHAEEDRHQDHRACHAATLAATWDVPNVFAYQAPSTRVDFRPQLFVSIEDELEEKLDLLAAYRSQGERVYLRREAISATARYWGRSAGGVPAEPLSVVREVRWATPPRGESPPELEGPPRRSGRAFELGAPLGSRAVEGGLPPRGTPTDDAAAPVART